jgi:hypothetical protein
VSKRSRRVEAARKKVVPAAEDLVHTAADRVGPLAHSAAEKVGPLAEAAADAIGAAADRVSPLAHSAAERVGPLAQSAADRVGPLAQTAADRLAPLAGHAVERVTPYAKDAADRVSPYTQAAASYAQLAADKVAPVATSARNRGVQVTEDAMKKFTPVLDDALDKVPPAVAAARERMAADLLPKLGTALGATAVMEEASKRAEATLAAAKGELVLPKKKKGRWIKRLAVVGAVIGVAVFVARKFFSSAEPDWQAARPTPPYAPSATPKSSAEESGVDAATGSAATATAAAEDDPQAGLSAHSQSLQANDAAVPDQPAEGGQEESEEPVAVEEDFAAAEPAAADEDLVVTEPPPEVALDDQPTAEGEPAVEETVVDEVVLTEPVAELPEGEPATEEVAGQPTSRYSGEGVYVGDEPPEGYVIKGNERSKKYHVPESGGYGRTIAEVWFNSEEAAQQAGFIRAQR